MLSPAQIQTARSTLGIKPAQTVSSGAPDRVAALQSAWGNSSSPAPVSTVASRVSADVQAAGDKVHEAITGTGDSTGEAPVVRGFEAAGAAAAAVPKVAVDIAPPTVRDAVKQVGDDLSSVVSWLGDKIGSTEAAQKFVQDHPDAAKALEQAAKIGQGAGAVAGTVLGADQAGGVVQAGADAAGATAQTAADGISDYLAKPAAKVEPTETSSLTDRIRTYMGKEGGVDPRLEASANRLADPIATYSEYANQAEKAVSDVKADAPISTVGENVGDAFDQVVKTRRSVGQEMHDELTKVKDQTVDLREPIAKAHSDVLEPGTAQLKPEVAGKMTASERELVGTYLHELNALGENPTVQELDGFLSRVPKELDQAKAVKNVTDATNADRIVKGSLADLRKALTGTKGLEAYAKARNAYSDLSNFLDEGSKYLGAKTQAGDYTRDTSLVKSSAESLLAGGKKDWLAKLEGLTGYKALDDATLAIQAMKDAGDTRGLSLFKTLGEGSMHPASLPFKVLGFGLKTVAKKALGSPREQTEAFLRSLKTAGTQDAPAPTSP